MGTTTFEPDSTGDWSPVPLRIALALSMLVHGLGNLGVGPSGPGSLDAFAEFLGTAAGIPMPSVFAIVVTVVEVGGGIALLLGVLTRYVAVLIAFDMAVAMVTVHLPNGYPVSNGGVELALTLFLIAVALALTGGGKLSLERAVFGREH